MNAPALPRERWRGVGHMEALRLKAAFEAMLAQLQAMSGEPGTLRERIARAEVRGQVEAWHAAAVEHLAALKRGRGWTSSVARRYRQHAAERDGGGAQARRAAPNVGAAGVVGAEPPPAMGHGWPAPSRAGSAATQGAAAGDAGGSNEGSAPS